MNELPETMSVAYIELRLLLIKKVFRMRTKKICIFTIANIFNNYRYGEK